MTQGHKWHLAFRTKKFFKIPLHGFKSIRLNSNICFNKSLLLDYSMHNAPEWRQATTGTRKQAFEIVGTRERARWKDTRVCTVHYIAFSQSNQEVEYGHRKV